MWKLKRCLEKDGNSCPTPCFPAVFKHFSGHFEVDNAIPMGSDRVNSLNVELNGISFDLGFFSTQKTLYEPLGRWIECILLQESSLNQINIFSRLGVQDMLAQTTFFFKTQMQRAL